MAATRLIIFIKKQDFRSFGVEIKLGSPSSYPTELMGPLREGFRQIFRPHHLYRQTGVVLAGLVAEDSIQHTLFDDTARIMKVSRVYDAVDRISSKYGKHTIHQASSLPTKLQAQHEGERGDKPLRTAALFKGENKRQRLRLPMLHIKV